MSPADWELWRVALVLADLPDGEELRPGGVEWAASQAEIMAGHLLSACEAALPGLVPLPPIEWQRARVPLWLRRLALREERPLQLGLWTPPEMPVEVPPMLIVAWEGQDSRAIVAVSSQLEAP